MDITDKEVWERSSKERETISMFDIRYLSLRSQWHGVLDLREGTTSIIFEGLLRHAERNGEKGVARTYIMACIGREVSREVGRDIIITFHTVLERLVHEFKLKIIDSGVCICVHV